MFEQLPTPPEDQIIGLMRQFRNDPREHKMDLSVGVYANEKGETIILDAVKKAEQHLLETQSTKTYVGMAGNLSFVQAMQAIVFGENKPTHIQGVQTPGGSGALRLIAELVKTHKTHSRIWLSTPTWPNHAALLKASGAEIKHYPYYDAKNQCVDFEAMRATLNTLSTDDIVVLHGCCHNPTGANLSHEQWDEVAALAQQKGFLPFIDMAYQGFGENLETDAYGVRQLANHVKEMVIAVSCSKNFGLYRDRVGCAFVMGRNEAETETAFKQLQTEARSMYSMPPDHGAAVVDIIWHDDTLRQQWLAELRHMTQRMQALRQQLAQKLKQATQSSRFDFIAQQQGMFSLLGLTPEQVTTLREKHAIYIVGDGRMNIAGLQEANLDVLVDALLDVIQ